MVASAPTVEYSIKTRRETRSIDHPLVSAEGKHALTGHGGRLSPDLLIIHADEPGVDQAVAMACQELGVTAEPRLANWHQTGLPTNGTKNRELIKAKPDLCVAIHQSIKTSKRSREDRKSTRLNSSHRSLSRMPSSA